MWGNIKEREEREREEIRPKDKNTNYTICNANQDDEKQTFTKDDWLGTKILKLFTMKNLHF